MSDRKAELEQKAKALRRNQTSSRRKEKGESSPRTSAVQT